MQYEITDKAAIEFSRSFYEAVADGLPVDAAVAEARTAISMASDLEWGTPVLYMRSSDGHIFDISETQQQDVQGQAARERYRKAVQEAWADNHVSDADAERLSALSSELDLSAETAADIERGVMGGTIETILGRQEEAARGEVRSSRLGELYAQARRSHQDQEWQAVVDLFAQIHAEDPDYLDREGFLQSASEALEQERRVTALYDRGEAHAHAREWQQALECFEEVQRLKPGYRETDALLSQARQELEPPQMVEVPDLGGQAVSQASSALASRGLSLGSQQKVRSDTVPEGRVIEQNPGPGVAVTPGGSVSVTVSSGPSPVEVPDLAGKSRSEVRNILRVAGLELGTTAEAQSDDVREGRVVQQYPEAGSETERGTSVRITLSSGPHNFQGPVREDAPQVPEAEFSISHPIGSFANVVWRVLIKPTAFYSAIPRRGNLLSPLMFAAICIGISIILREVIKLRLSDTGLEYPGGFGTFFTAVIAGLIIAPIVLLAVAGILHLLVVLIAGSRNSGFGGTLRVSAYAYVTSLVSWIPYVGWIASLYSIYLAIVGIREVHNTSTSRATILVLMPAIVVLLLALAAIVFGFLSAL
jgi:tetratricopeptide (TPR) repeat protein